MPANPTPTKDGEINTYYTEIGRGDFFDENRRVIFINGMGNSGADHRSSAMALSALQMCPVIGIYNMSSGFFPDLGQCIADKWQFNNPMPGDPAKAFEELVKETQKKDPSKTRAAIARDVVSRNGACAAVFDVLRDPAMKTYPIFAHSQGNLILSNALQAVALADGAGAIAGREIWSYGSPCRTWPSGILRRDHAFTFDPVGWLTATFTLDISKIGVPTGHVVPFAHSFSLYMDNDPEFIVNRHRWGSLGMTVSLDEDAIASDLVSMGVNAPRIYKVMKWIDERHHVDVDDVALAYITRMRQSPAGASTLKTLKRHTDLFPLLIKAMEGGWTTSAEKDAIAFLKAV